MKDRLISIFRKTLASPVGKWVIVGILVGIIAGTGAILFYLAIEFATRFILEGITGFSPPRSGIVAGTTFYTMSEGPYFFLLPVSVGLGGFIVGIILNKTAPEAKGHGTDAAIDAFHNKNGKIRRRIPFIKTIASAITIGSGGSAGREGPTAQIAAGFGSFVADVFKFDDHDRRIAMAAGIGAGIGSIFLAPLGGAILSTEILYKRDFEVEALIPSVIASVVGYSIFGLFSGFKTIFAIPVNTTIGFFYPQSLLAYVLVGIAAGLGAIFYIKVFYGISGFFSKLKKVSPYAKPAIGGISVGLIALFFPEVIGLGYGWTQQLLDGNISLFEMGWGNNYYALFTILLILFALKVVATSLTIGSEGSGGVFAPALVAGSFLGYAISIPIVGIDPTLSTADIIVVTMIALFGGASKAPIAIIIMGTEMTGTYSLFIPLMLATTISYFITGDMTIYRSQVSDRSMSPAHESEYRKPIMENIPIYTAMNKDYIRIGKVNSIREAIEKIRSSRTKGIVVENNGKLEGYISIENIPQDVNYDETVETVMLQDVPIISSNKSLHDALNMIVNESTGKLVVVDNNEMDKILGTLTLSEISEAYNREIRRIKERTRPLKSRAI